MNDYLKIFLIFLFGVLFWAIGGAFFEVQKSNRTLEDYAENHRIKTRVDENTTHIMITTYSNSEGLIYTVSHKKLATVPLDVEHMTSAQIQAMYEAYNKHKEVK